MKSSTAEQEVRKLRANIYGECSDKNWDYCKEKWMEPENMKWLMDHQYHQPKGTQ